MKVLQLPDVLHEYLVHVLTQHAASGIHPEEGMAIAKLWEACTKQATHVPDNDIAKMVAAGTAAGQSVPAVTKVAASFAEGGLVDVKTQQDVYAAHVPRTHGFTHGDPGDEHADSEHSEIIREITGH